MIEVSEKQYEEIKQASNLESDRVEVSDLSAGVLKETARYMLTASQKIDNSQPATD